MNIHFLKQTKLHGLLEQNAMAKMYSAYTSCNYHDVMSYPPWISVRQVRCTYCKHVFIVKYDRWITSNAVQMLESKFWF